MTNSDKLAVVTGAGSGIGKATAFALLNAGYRVVFAGRRAAVLNEAVQESGAGARALAIPTDVSQEDSVHALFTQVREECGRIDVLSNNAGTNVRGVSFEDLSLAQWQAVVDVNLNGMFLCAQGAFRLMKAQSPTGGGASLTTAPSRPFLRGSTRRPTPAPSMR